MQKEKVDFDLKAIFSEPSLIKEKELKKDYFQLHNEMIKNFYNFNDSEKTRVKEEIEKFSIFMKNKDNLDIKQIEELYEKQNKYKFVSMISAFSIIILFIFLTISFVTIMTNLLNNNIPTIGILNSVLLISTQLLSMKLLINFFSKMNTTYEEKREMVANRFKNLVEKNFSNINWVTLMNKDRDKKEVIDEINNMSENKMWYVMYKKMTGR